MNNQLQKLGILAVSAAIGLAVAQIKPAEALVPYYRYSFYMGDNEDDGFGVLTFSDRTKITGIGTESIKLSEIEGAIFEYASPVNSDYNDDFDPTLVFKDWDNDPIFTFNSGLLTGLEFYASADFSGSGCRYGYPCREISGTNTLNVTGDSYRKTVSGSVYNVDIVGYDPETGEDILEYTEESFGYTLSSGSITFYNPLPVEPIPEPLTILGTSAVIGFGTFFKRKLAKKRD